MHPSRREFSAAVLVVGLVAVAVAVLFDKGPWLYAAGVLAAAAGAGALVLRPGASRARRGVAGVVALAVAGAGALALFGVPSRPSHWQLDAESPTVQFVAGGRALAGATAYDLRTGEVRWKASSPRTQTVVAATAEVTLMLDRGATTLTGHDTNSGRQLWSVPTQTDPEPLAFDDRTIVLNGEDNSVVRGYDLATGAHTWQRVGYAVPQCVQRGFYRDAQRAVRQSSVILLATADVFDHDQATSAVAVTGGRVQVSSVDCRRVTRFAGDTMVQRSAVDEGGPSRFGWSLQTGQPRWDGRGPVYPSYGLRDFPGGARNVWFANRSATWEPRATRTPIDRIEVSTGARSSVTPPPGYSYWLPDLALLQHTDTVWVPVRSDSGYGVWQLGTDRVVVVPGAEGLDVADVDSSGWLALHGTTTNLVGTVTQQAWALSPAGVLHGPFTGHSAHILPELIDVDGIKYPLP